MFDTEETSEPRGERFEPVEARGPLLVAVALDPLTREALGAWEEPLRVHESDPGGLLGDLRRSGPELLLLDAEGLSGEPVQVISALREDPRTADIAAIVLSADEAVGFRCLDAGAADFVHKPIRPAELRARLRRALRDAGQHRALRALATTDALTGLANFRALEQRADQEFQRAIRYRYPLSVATIDLDHLKEINDHLGHEAGNQAIIRLAQVLRTNLREADFAARFGGDEFVVILPYQTPSEAAVFAERLRTNLRMGRAVGGPAAGTSVSIGIAGHWPDGPKPGTAELLRASDAALCEAKRRGRDRVVVYEWSLAGEAGPELPSH